MIRTLVCAAASLLLVGTLYAEDKEKAAAPETKPEAKAVGATQSTPEKKPGAAAPEQRKRGRPQADGPRGRVTKASIENGILKLSLDGKDYDFPITDNTRAMLRTTEKDGKEVVVGVQIMNGDGRQGGRRPAGQPRTRPKTKP